MMTLVTKRHVHPILPLVAILDVCCALSSGCSLVDLNYNPEARYEMAMRHARQVLQESNSVLEPFSPDYALMEFDRGHYDESSRVLHHLELYDFVKTSKKPGPDRFVIAYDFATRKTYLRTDLRSNENIEWLPTTQPSKE